MQPTSSTRSRMHSSYLIATSYAFILSGCLWDALIDDPVASSDASSTAEISTGGSSALDVPTGNSSTAPDSEGTPPTTSTTEATSGGGSISGDTSSPSCGHTGEACCPGGCLDGGLECIDGTCRPPPCEACMMTHCASAAEACSTNNDCQSVVACIDQSPINCLKSWPACWANNPKGEELFLAHMSCINQNCADVCSQNSSCYDLGQSCDANVECNAISTCINTTCHDLPCWEMCKQQHPDGRALHDELIRCLNSGCP